MPMKFNTWPQPPIHSNKAPPEIPQRFRLFGLDYRVENGNPVLDMPSKPLNKAHVKECLDKSYELFLKILKTQDGEILNEIRDLHAHINEEINMAIVFDKAAALQTSINEMRAMKSELLKKIDQITKKKSKFTD